MYTAVMQDDKPGITIEDSLFSKYFYWMIFVIYFN